VVVTKVEGGALVCCGEEMERMERAEVFKKDLKATQCNRFVIKLFKFL
jgi:hypothetical protein